MFRKLSSASVGFIYRHFNLVNSSDVITQRGRFRLHACDGLSRSKQLCTRFSRFATTFHAHACFVLFPDDVSSEMLTSSTVGARGGAHDGARGGASRHPNRRCSNRSRSSNLTVALSVFRSGTFNALVSCVVILVQLLTWSPQHGSDAIEWLATSNDTRHFWNSSSDCFAFRHALTKPQRQICRKNLDVMVFVSTASKNVMDVCQELFLDRRWNCSSIRLAPAYTPDLTGGSREQAFVYALSSASLMRSVAKGCGSGATTKCQCGKIPVEPSTADFRWGGCSDDVTFGSVFSRSFTDTKWKHKKRPSTKSLTILHNNAVGRKIARESFATTCKCHGVSGSCSVKTCWKSLPVLNTIGLEIQRRFAMAVEVESKELANKRRLVPVSTDRKSISDEDLVYYTISPDYCLPDQSLGSVGTRSRECITDRIGPGDCRTMCCGRGFTTEKTELQYRCECKYYWCCYVKCKICTKTVEISRCR